MRFCTYVSLFVLLTSCSSIDKAKVYSGIVGVVVGGFTGSVIGKMTSPNPESEGINGALGAMTGATAGYLVGSRLGAKFFKDDPENFKGETIEFKPIINDDPQIILE